MKDSTSSADSVALKPCPFCGGTGEYCETGVLWVRCEACGSDAQHGGTRKAAAANWNRRALAVEARCESCPWAGGCLNCPDRALAVEEPKPQAEPTEAMCVAMVRYVFGNLPPCNAAWEDVMRGAYKAALAAAPMDAVGDMAGEERT